MVFAGDAKVEVRREGKASKWVALGPGQFFGELGLISGRRRSTTVKAGPDCVLIEAPRRAMLKLIATVEAGRKEGDEAVLQRAGRNYLAPLLPNAQLAALVSPGVAGKPA